MEKPEIHLRCVIIDDEPFAIDLLSDYIDRAPGLKLAATFTSPIKALQFLRKEEVDLLLLDIQMPELNGLQFARIIGDEHKVIFTTAYAEHALESYELSAVDYLLKPISFERFCTAIEKLESPESTTPGTQEQQTVSDGRIIFVKSGHKTLRILLDDILFLSGSGDYVTILLKGDKKVLTLEKMNHFERKLLPPKFCRIHRSHLVALDKIDFIERQRVIINGTWLPISQSYQDTFWALVDSKS